MTFKKAERKQARPKLAITGPSGSGKTFSALLIAAGMGKKIAVIDTENGSASLYADVEKGALKGIEFDTLEIAPPYTIDKYVLAIQAAEEASYDVLIVDSISHAWAGEGGLLSKKEALDQRGGNSYTNWAGITKEHEIFKSRILAADVAMICTMRSKQDYVLETNDKGKSAPKKVGMAPIQRDGMEYEFTVVLDLAMDHNAQASKDRTGLFDGKIFKPSKETGKAIMEWLKGGVPLASKAKPGPTPAPTLPPSAMKPADLPPADEQPTETITKEQLNAITAAVEAIVKTGRWSQDKIWTGIRSQVPRDFAELNELSKLEADAVLEYVNRWVGFIVPNPAPKSTTKAAAAAGRA